MFSFMFLLYKCANQLPPSGGDVDMIPPEITETYPLNGQTNFDDEYIQINFSEYVDKRSVKEAIFISPEISGDLDFDWSGTNLSIYFNKDSLKSYTTYTVTIGTDIKDINNRNNLETSVTFAFSTGNKIDQGMLAGKVYGNSLTGASIYAYKLVDSIEFNPIKIKPDYISQVSADGNFQLLGLAKSKYRLLAIKDNFKDRLYNREDDFFGITTSDYEISETDSVYSNINFKLTLEDTTKPSVQNVTMTDSRHLFLEISEPIDSSKFDLAEFIIIDSTNGSITKPLFIYKGKAKSGELFLALKDTLDLDGSFYIQSKGLVDYSNNKSISETTSFVVNENKDTSAIEIVEVKKEFKDDQIDFINPHVTVLLNDGVSLENMKQAAAFYDSRKNKIEIEVLEINSTEFKINIQKKLEPKKDFTFELDGNYLIDAAGNKTDSVYSYKIKTINDLDFSGVSGKVNYIGNSNVFVVLKTAEKRSTIKTYKQKAIDGEINFERVTPGKYLAWAFEDKDSNIVYTYGNAEPFNFSEKFAYYQDTLNLRPRWPVGDMIIDLTK